MEFFEDNHVELYNLRDDLSEKNDLASKNAPKAKELQTRLAAWRKDLNAPMPTPNNVKASSDVSKKKKEKNKKSLFLAVP